MHAKLIVVLVILLTKLKGSVKGKINVVIPHRHSSYTPLDLRVHEKAPV
jgi:hypothetical protein